MLSKWRRCCRHQVDLGSSQSIGSIQVWPRTDCCPEHTANFYVFVSDSPFTSTDLIQPIISLAFPTIGSLVTTPRLQRSTLTALVVTCAYNATTRNTWY